MLHISAGTSSITTRRSSCQKAERTKAERTFVLSQAGQEADSWSLTSMVAPFMWFRGSAEGRSLPRILIERDASAHHLPGGCHDVIGIWTHPVEHLGRCGWRRIRKCDALIVRAVHVLRHARNNLGARAERIIGLIEREQALGLLHRFDQCFRVH